MAALVLTALSISPVFKDSDQGISNAIFCPLFLTRTRVSSAGTFLTCNQFRSLIEFDEFFSGF